MTQHNTSAIFNSHLRPKTKIEWIWNTGGWIKKSHEKERHQKTKFKKIKQMTCKNKK